MLKKSLKSIYENIMMNPLRFKSWFIKLKEIFSYSDREKLILQVMDYARSNKMEGDYLEFGVYKGGTLIPAYHFSKAMGKNLENMHFYGFDSFEGLPEIKGLDKEKFAHFSKGDYTQSMSNLIKNLKCSKMDLKRVKLIKGWYDKVLNQDLQKRLPLKKAAIIWIDCDLYESTIPVLKFIKKYIQNGTIIIFDDWYCFRGNPEQGEQKAFSEWLKKNKEVKAIPFRQSYWGGNSFIIRLQGEFNN